jgi:hypothetical protein
MSKGAYELRMQAIARQTDAAQARAAKHPRVSGIVLADEQAAIMTQEADNLASIDPPTEVAADHAVLLDADRALAANSRALALFLAHKGAKPNPNTSLVWLSRTFNAVSDFRAKHYHLGGFTDG